MRPKKKRDQLARKCRLLAATLTDPEYQRSAATLKELADVLERTEIEERIYKLNLRPQIRSKIEPIYDDEPSDLTHIAAGVRAARQWRSFMKQRAIERSGVTPLSRAIARDQVALEAPNETAPKGLVGAGQPPLAPPWFSSLSGACPSPMCSSSLAILGRTLGRATRGE